MKKTKKHLTAALAESGARIDRLQDELRTTRQLNDQLRETLDRVTKERAEFSQRFADLDRHSDKREDRMARSFRSSAVERQTWTDLFAAEIANRAETVTLVRDLRRCVGKAVQNIVQLQKRVRTLNQNRVYSTEGVYVKSSDLVDLLYVTDQIDHFVKGTELEQLLEESGNESTDE